MQEPFGTPGIPRHHARLHVGDALPSLGGAGKIFLERTFRNHQWTAGAVGAKPGVHREQHALAGVGGDQVHQAPGDARPEFQLRRLVIGQDEHQVGIRGQVKLAHPQTPERHHPHLVRRFIPVLRRIAGAHLRQGDLIGSRDDGVGEIGGVNQGVENRLRQAHAGGLDAHHFPPIPAAQLGGSRGCDREPAGGRHRDGRAA